MSELSTGRLKKRRTQIMPVVAEPPAPNSEPPDVTFSVYRNGTGTIGGRLPGDRYVRVGRRQSSQLPCEEDFHVLPGNVPPTPRGVRLALTRIKRVLIGRP